MDDIYIDERITGGDSWDRQKIGQAVKCVNVKQHVYEVERERGRGWIDDGGVLADGQ